ncbi:MAG: hemolysin III family protein [Clostridia bacterium]|nr:hemolysin III family protein [Clostridia bacterium]
MTRTRLRDRLLPTYTGGEERFHMISHIVGGGFGVLALVLCVVKAALDGSVSGVVRGALYGASLIALYAMSSIYHGLRHPMAKKVFQVLDHCTIYFLIGGTYTPILLCAVRAVSPGWAWTLFGIVWGLAALATVLTAIDLKKYAVFSMCCYIGMGWCVLLAARTVVQAIAPVGLLLLLGGGIAYTVGAVLYGLGKRRRYMHALFHLFVLVGSVLHFFCILFYVL